MEIRILRYFLAVAREESITRAAELLHITQPTLSRQLAQLEESVGAKLLERGARKVTLTDEGILLKRRAEEIVSLVDKTEKELRRQDELVEGTIAIGCGELMSVTLLAEIIEAFVEKYPRVNFDLYTATADEVKEQIDRGVLDIGLLMEPIDIEKYGFIRLNMQERWVALMRPDDPLAQKEVITPGDLVDQPLIIPRRPSVQNEVLNWFGGSPRDLKIRFTNNLTTNGAVMVHQGLGCALTIEGAVPFWDQSKITYRPLSPEMSATSVLAWKRQQPFGPAVTKFIVCLKEFLKDADER
ncbi:MAG: LysR family transcriptional regulator [Eubacterium sp.]|nr:LysR family transcriptional regulator [Eubacterium sp.]